MVVKHAPPTAFTQHKALRPTIFIVFILMTLQKLSVKGCTTVRDGQQCGPGAGGNGNDGCCPSGQCCSEYGWCGVLDVHCGSGCKSAYGSCGINTVPPGPPVPPADPGNRVAKIVSRDLWNTMFQQPSNCPGKTFYSYDAFIAATAYYPKFGTASSKRVRNRREVAAFLAQISQETFGAELTGGLCWITELSCGQYCDTSSSFSCAAGKQYCGRGPMQLSWNYNYGLAGQQMGIPSLLTNPEQIAGDPVLAFRTALWFWMTPQSPKPSCHQIMTKKYTLTQADIAAGRHLSFGFTTNVINGGIECNQPVQQPQVNRVTFFRRYCQLMGITPGKNLYCDNQQSFG